MTTLRYNIEEWRCTGVALANQILRRKILPVEMLGGAWKKLIVVLYK